MTCMFLKYEYSSGEYQFLDSIYIILKIKTGISKYIFCNMSIFNFGYSVFFWFRN